MGRQSGAKALPARLFGNSIIRDMQSNPCRLQRYYASACYQKRSLLWAIVLLAFGLRWPLPLREWTQVDKRDLVLHSLGFWGGDFNPHFFHYPALFYVYFLLPRAEAL